jgi:hypothetical protein
MTWRQAFVPAEYVLGHTCRMRDVSPCAPLYTCAPLYLLVRGKLANKRYSYTGWFGNVLWPPWGGFSVWQRNLRPGHAAPRLTSLSKGGNAHAARDRKVVQP